MLLAGGENALHRTCMREPTRESESENQVQMAGGQEFSILIMRVVRIWGKVECGWCCSSLGFRCAIPEQREGD